MVNGTPVGIEGCTAAGWKTLNQADVKATVVDANTFTIPISTVGFTGNWNASGCTITKRWWPIAAANKATLGVYPYAYQKLAATTYATLAANQPADAGIIATCSDCTVANPCGAGGGTGALAVSTPNGSGGFKWVCK
jgi:hypothetical protein